jgi:omega-amidase
MLAKVVLVQCEVGRQLTQEQSLTILKHRPDFVVLPEYYNISPTQNDTGRNALDLPRYLEYCRVLSDRLDVVLISGTAIEPADGKFFNTCFIFERGSFVGRYRKLNPTTGEFDRGISSGNGHILLQFNGIRYSALICADVLNKAGFDYLSRLRPDIIFIPTTSPLRRGEQVREKFDRDNQIFVAASQLTCSFIVKCCAVGRLWGADLQGRSLVTAPWGIMVRNSPEEENRPRLLSATLDIFELREFRRKRIIAPAQDLNNPAC